MDLHLILSSITGMSNKRAPVAWWNRNDARINAAHDQSWQVDLRPGVCSHQLLDFLGDDHAMPTRTFRPVLLRLAVPGLVHHLSMGNNSDRECAVLNGELQLGQYQDCCWCSPGS